MDINEFLQEIKSIYWFDHGDELESTYYRVSSIFEAYDTWNEQMLKTWEPHITQLENMAIEQIGDLQIDEIFSMVSLEIEDIVWKKWCDFINRWHLEKETGLENEMMDMVKRDLSWACIERVLNVQGFFSKLLQVYKKGFFPCSWMGDYPSGKMVVL